VLSLGSEGGTFPIDTSCFFHTFVATGMDKDDEDKRDAVLNAVTAWFVEKANDDTSNDKKN